MCMFCRSLFVFFYFFFWPLFYLFFDIRILITSLVSSISLTFVWRDAVKTLRNQKNCYTCSFITLNCWQTFDQPLTTNNLVYWCSISWKKNLRKKAVSHLETQIQQISWDELECSGQLSSSCSKRHSSCLSCYNTDEQSYMRTEPDCDYDKRQISVGVDDTLRD
jgi:hypothetical protein